MCQYAIISSLWTSRTNHGFVFAFLDFDIKGFVSDFSLDDLVVDIAERFGVHADHVLTKTARDRLVRLSEQEKIASRN